MREPFATSFPPRLRMVTNVLREYVEGSEVNHWTFRPSDRGPSLLELVMDALYTAHAFLNAIEKGRVSQGLETRRIKGRPPESKAALLAELDMMVEMAEAASQALSPEQLQKPVEHPQGWTTSLENMLWFMRDHLVHYAGQLAVYFRCLGLPEVEVADLVPVQAAP